VEPGGTKCHSLTPFPSFFTLINARDWFQEPGLGLVSRSSIGLLPFERQRYDKLSSRVMNPPQRFFNAYRGEKVTRLIF